MRSAIQVCLFGVLTLFGTSCQAPSMAQSTGQTGDQTASQAAQSLPQVPNFTVATVPEDQVVLTLHVDGTGLGASDSNPGTTQQPFRTISAALAAAQKNNARRIGTKILIHSGVYREQLLLPIRADVTSSPIVIEGESKGKVILSGADLWTNWQPVPGTRMYTHAWPHHWGLSAYPPGWEGNVLLQDIARRREMIFVNGQLMRQVLVQPALTDNSFYVSEATGTIFLQPGSGISLDAATVEVAVRTPLVRAQGRSNLVLRGITFQHSNSAIPDGAVELVDCTRILVEDCDFTWNNWDGLAVLNASDVTLRRTSAKHNGASGSGGYKLKRVLYENSETSNNNWRGAAGGFYGWAVAGSKFNESHDLLVRNHRALSNQTRGLWFDSDTVNLTIESCELGRNFTDGIFIEANQGPIVLRSCFIHENLNGVLGANSTNVTLLGNYFLGNRDAHIQITGVPFRNTSNWETGAAYNLAAQDWTVRGNFFQSESAAQMWLSTPNWQPFLGSLRSDGNYWTRPQDLRGFRVGSVPWTFAEWQKYLGTDRSSAASAW